MVASRFRILSEDEGEGIEMLPIEGELHAPWGTDTESAAAADQKTES